MNIAFFSYSYTGNNKAIADSVAKKMSAEHVQIIEQKQRTMGTIILDMLFNRKPDVYPAPDIMEKYDIIIFFGPIWMGLVASPIRPYLKYLKEHPQKYGFVSISGGADGSNPKLKDELKKLTGVEPITLIDLHIANLLPSNPKPSRKVTSAYRLNDKDIKALSNEITQTLEGRI